MKDEALCIARIVEPTSKLDSLRVLADLGYDFFQKTTIFRYLSRVVDQEYRKIISRACFDHING